MRLLDKYLSREYLKLYFMLTPFFIAFFLLTDFFTSIANLREGTKFLAVTQYYLLQIPYLLSLLSPVGVLMATLLTISHLGGTYQIQAAQISGVPVKRIVLPLLTIGIISSFVILFLDQSLIFRANQVAQRLKQENFLGPPPEQIQKNIFIHVPPSYLFYIRAFDPKQGKMENVLIYERVLPPRITAAKEASWVEKGWLLRHGMDYRLGEELEGTPFEEKIFLLDNEPSYFGKKYFPPEKMNIAELNRQIDEYRKSGLEILDLETELNFKVSYPFTNFILLFLGIPLGMLLRKGGKGASFGLSLVIGFGYYETIAFFKILAKSGAVSPFVVAWLPSFIFVAVGAYLYTLIE